MTLTQMRYLVAIAEQGSFAKAAELCLVSQPTLSLQIQKMEQEIGIPLLDRTKTPVLPTSHGKEVIEQAKVVLREAEKIETILQKKQKEPVGKLRLGIIPTLASSFLSKLFGEVKKKAPKLDLRISELPTSQIIDAIKKEELDLGLLATPLEERDLVEIPLMYEKFLPYFPPGYKGKKKSIPWDELVSEQWIVLGEDHCFRNQMLRICHLHGAGRLECASLSTLKQLVDDGHGLTLLPEFAIDKQSSQVGSFQDPEPVREISLVHKQGFTKQHLLVVIQGILVSLFPATAQTKGKKKRIPVEL